MVTALALAFSLGISRSTQLFKYKVRVEGSRWQMVVKDGASGRGG